MYFLAACRDCRVGECLSVPRANGGCPACICEGLLMADCQEFNCTVPCTVQPTPDGCSTCSCPRSTAQQKEAVCPPIPACPSRCQVQLGSGCPRCTCPEEVAPQCPQVTCPHTCTVITGVDGCPACECPPQDRVCPKLPACALGCIDLSDDPQHEGCLSCNCTLAADLIAQNQILPNSEQDPTISPDVEIITIETIDPGLINPTELDVNQLTGDINPNGIAVNNPLTPANGPIDPLLINPNNQPASSIPVNSNIQPAGSPPVNPNIQPVSSLPVNPNIQPVSSLPVNPNIQPTGSLPIIPNIQQAGPLPTHHSTQPEGSILPTPNIQPASVLPNPFAPNAVNPNADVPLPTATRHRPQSHNNGLNNQPTQQSPLLNIPCGETSCPPGCSLCIQRNSCGRCLCGNLARVCPAVPACRPSCISAGPGGCFSCTCPAPSTVGPGGGFNAPGFGPPLGFQPFPGQQRFNPQLVPSILGFSFGSEEREDSPFGPFIRGRPGPVRLGGPARLGGPPRLGRPTHRQPSPGQIAVQNIPQGLLGTSRFEIFV